MFGSALLGGPLLRRAVFGGLALRRCCALCGGRTLRRRGAVCRRLALRGWGLDMDELRRAAQEALFCESILAKSSDNVLLETLRGAAPVTWDHYPPGDVFDAASGAQWYYHCHDARPEAVEHGHFHCFIRPEGRGGPIHHLIAVGVDPYGRLIRLFTVNQWVVDDAWADAEASIGWLPSFDVQLAKPSYLVNRWLTAIIGLYHDEISTLIRQRDAALASHGPEARQDRSREVLSELAVDLRARADALGV